MTEIDNRVFLTVDQAIEMLPDRNTIHTFLDGVFLIGADWDKDDIIEGLKAAPENGIQLSRPFASSMGHGFCFAKEYRGRGWRWVFVETTEGG